MKVKHNRINKISLRLTDNEMNLLETNASLCGLNKSAFVRDVLLKAKPPIHKFDKAMVNQLSRVGSNLNQITKHVNTNKSIDSIVLKRIIEISNSINSLLDKDKNC
ncbi:plasmid mobilization relaxosome protein MobC [Campylobacter sp. RM16190]|uniref:plasmid mobilization protein n=1 Tax=Campylobacter sp. RM16190 TaxID=1705727 RepID=UPI0014756E1E|nr:plasmid mobilization relaxosome protein MobC [Campylobacter sp. RM16190]